MQRNTNVSSQARIFLRVMELQGVLNQASPEELERILAALTTFRSKVVNLKTESLSASNADLAQVEADLESYKEVLVNMKRSGQGF